MSHCTQPVSQCSVQCLATPKKQNEQAIYVGLLVAAGEAVAFPCGLPK